LTTSERPPNSVPLTPAIAALPWLGSSNSTKPKPRERPLELSMITFDEATAPKAANSSRNSSSRASKGRLPT